MRGRPSAGPRGAGGKTVLEGRIPQQRRDQPKLRALQVGGTLERAAPASEDPRHAGPTLQAHLPPPARACGEIDSEAFELAFDEGAEEEAEDGKEKECDDELVARRVALEARREHVTFLARCSVGVYVW